MYENASQKKCKLKVLNEPEIRPSELGPKECHFFADLEFDDGTKAEKKEVWFPIGIPNTHVPKKDDEFQATVSLLEDAFSLIEIL